MKQTERTLARRNLARRSGASVPKDAHVIQAVLPDGFTYWYAGLGDIQIGENIIKGDKWSPYYHDAVKGNQDIIGKVMDTVLKDNVNNAKAVPILEAAWDKSFDLYPANLTAYIEYEAEQRQKTTAGLRAVDTDTDEGKVGLEDKPAVCSICGSAVAEPEDRLCIKCAESLANEDVEIDA